MEPFFPIRLAALQKAEGGGEVEEKDGAEEAKMANPFRPIEVSVHPTTADR